MNFRVRVPRIILLLCAISSFVVADQLDFVPLSFDSLYPKTDYNFVAQALKELWSDLDLLQAHRDLQGRFIYESDYLIDQYLLLERQLAHLVERNEDFCSYLKEDIEYLAYLIEQLEGKSESVCQNLDKNHRQSVQCTIVVLLEKCRLHIGRLLIQNKEVIS